ncbi:MAG: hypothetical protein IRZ09_05220 [Variibacter sp.]|nr:hypothetical protein [Variibacter sp.]
MKDHPLVIKLMCVALVASLMVPIGRLAFPLVADTIGTLEFSTIEAVMSATLGFGLYAALFG